AGAEINSVNNDQNSALHYAAEYGNFDIVRSLCENGASINQLNEDDWTALDFAIIGKRSGIEEYLTNHGGMVFSKRLPSFVDGPYMEILPADQLKVSYLSHDSIENTSRIIYTTNAFNSSTCKVEGIGEDETFYVINKDYTVPPSVYIDVSRILAVGDIHGQYSRMTGILMEAGVINEDLQWQWGDGHLVFTGDIFDRGNQVTECLWFIYNLEKQADIHNGKVHLLLGNHEFMVLNNDIRYISNRYYGITSNLELDYAELFNRNTILGKWLRSKNTIEKINDLIFVHAGISHEFDLRNISIDSTNDALRATLNGQSNSNPSELQEFLLGNQGPIWYRGYFRGSRRVPKMNFEEMDDVLTAYGAESIIVGHTETDTISSIYNSAVIDINVPLWNRNIPGQALLIENDHFYRVYISGDRIVIK
ncbi:hypothetical protein LCGC14_2003370, partial [marine sediment metagenome]